MNAQILYLPTYRRIERELGSIFEDIDADDFKRRSHFRRRQTEKDYIELVEFGMEDVKQAIDATLVNIKEFARENLNNLTSGYLGDIVNQSYLTSKIEFIDVSNEIVNSVLNRIDEGILKKEHKDHVFKVITSASSESITSEHDMIIKHYFLKLLKFQKSLTEKEENISSFCTLCSDYIVDKDFIYDGTNFKFSIVPKGNKYTTDEIKLSDLSSGEKQIVSLFSHLYLSEKRNYFLLIDEPELSLSVTWQQRFLTDIKNGSFCKGIVAVTHSPFIYNNELRPYARALGEFISF